MESAIKSFLKKLRLSESTLSTILGALVTVVIGVLIFNYFKQIGKVEQISEEPAATTEVVEEAGVAFEKTEEGKFVPQALPKVHKVERGEHLWQIAESYYGSGYNWVDIAQENELQEPGLLAIGQELNIPKVEAKQITKLAAEKGGEIASAVAVSSIEEDTYKVQKDDNLWKIAVRAYQDGYRWQEIAKANSLTNPNHIEVEQELKLPR